MLLRADLRTLPSARPQLSRKSFRLAAQVRSRRGDWYLRVAEPVPGESFRPNLRLLHFTEYAESVIQHSPALAESRPTPGTDTMEPGNAESVVQSEVWSDVLQNTFSVRRDRCCIPGVGRHGRPTPGYAA